MTEEIREQGKEERGQEAANFGDRAVRRVGNKGTRLVSGPDLHTLGDSLSQEEGTQRKRRDSSYPLQLHSSISCPLHFLTVNL